MSLHSGAKGRLDSKYFMKRNSGAILEKFLICQVYPEIVAYRYLIPVSNGAITVNTDRHFF